MSPRNSDVDELGGRQLRGLAYSWDCGRATDEPTFRRLTTLRPPRTRLERFCREAITRRPTLEEKIFDRVLDALTRPIEDNGSPTSTAVWTDLNPREAARAADLTYYSFTSGPHRTLEPRADIPAN